MQQYYHIMAAPPLPDDDCDDDDDDGTTITCDVEAFFVEPMVDTLSLRYSLEVTYYGT